MIDIDIFIEAEGWPEKDTLQTLVQKIIDTSLEILEFDAKDSIRSELSLVCTHDGAMRTLNARWRGKDESTNVLSFPIFSVKVGERPGPMLGDIIIARETVEREAILEGKSFNHHFTHLVVHGFLHLLGYDHENDAQSTFMEGLERKILEALAIADPYAVLKDDIFD